MAVTKYETQAITSGAGLEVQSAINTQDGNQVRRLLGIQSSDHTAGNKTRIYYNSKNIVEIDNSVFATLRDFADLDIEVPVNLNLQFAFFNGTGGSLTTQITFKYSTPNV